MAKPKAKPLADLRETTEEVRAELAAEFPLPQVPKEPPTPRYTADGVLLNPEDFNVGKDGVLMAKAA